MPSEPRPIAEIREALFGTNALPDRHFHVLQRAIDDYEIRCRDLSAAEDRIRALTEALTAVIQVRGSAESAAPKMYRLALNALAAASAQPLAEPEEKP